MITIHDLIPLLKNGWVAMNEDGTWCWFSQKPSIGDIEWIWVGRVRFLDSFNIKKARKWKYSLIKVKHKEEQEATEADVGKLCWFWDDDDENDKKVDVLKDTSIGPRHFERKTAGWYYHCRRLSPAEVAEITGYGVTEDGSTFYGEPFKPVLEGVK